MDDIRAAGGPRAALEPWVQAAERLHSPEINQAAYEDVQRRISKTSRTETRQITYCPSCRKKETHLWQSAWMICCWTTGARTELGAGVLLALECLDRRRQALSDKGNSFYKPWLILISDGEATDAGACRKASAEVSMRRVRRRPDPFASEQISAKKGRL